jgi:Flp pilus assembly protein TadD
MKLALSILLFVFVVAGCAAQQDSSLMSSSLVSNGTPTPEAETELQTGIKLTSSGSFSAAIPHLLGARGHVTDEYAAGFDLALCYVATGQFKDAIAVLTSLLGGSHDASVYNLLAQAYIGNNQEQLALDSFGKAAALTPANEKLYLFVADACMDSQNYSLGLKVADRGLQNLPQSARLHYQRGTFFAHLDQLDLARKDFDLVQTLEPESDIAYIAQAEESLFAGDTSGAIQAARTGIAKQPATTALLTIFGEALVRSGIAPGQPEFAEARTAFEKSVAARPNDTSAQIDLGKLYLMENRLDNAIAHLEIARRLEPGNPSPYSNLARAYRRRGETAQAQEMLKILSAMNREQAERIAGAPGDSKASYVTAGKEK